MTGGASSAAACRVGYIGLGQMGAAMAGWLTSRCGQGGAASAVTVFDIDAAAMEPLVASGATPATSPAEVAASCDVVSICVPAAQHVQQVLAGPNGIAEAAVEGQPLLVHSTIAPDDVRAARDTATAWGGSVHDACIYGGVVNAQQGELVVFAGGLGDMRGDAVAVLDTYGSLVVDCGAVGSGAALKVAANVMTYSQFMAASVAYEIAHRADADPQRVIDALRQNGMLGVLTERFMPVLGMSVGGRDLPEALRPLMEASTGIAVKDLGVAAELLAAEPPLHRAIEALSEAMAAVYGVDRSES